MRRQILTFSCIGMLLLINAARADTALRCGDTTFVVEKSFFGGTVTRRNGAVERPFCISDDPAVLTKTLSFRDAEIWCVTLHHLSPNTRPLAKQLWVSIGSTGNYIRMIMCSLMALGRCSESVLRHVKS